MAIVLRQNQFFSIGHRRNFETGESSGNSMAVVLRQNQFYSIDPGGTLKQAIRSSSIHP